MTSWRCVTSEVAFAAPVWPAALWWASLTALGGWVVPLLFIHLPSPSLAGAMAARLFSAQAWVSLLCGLLLLWFLTKNRAAARVDKQFSAIKWVVVGMILAAVIEWAVAPRIVARDSLRLWHAIATLLFLMQWLCSAAALQAVLRRALAPPQD